MVENEDLERAISSSKVESQLCLSKTSIPVKALSNGMAHSGS